jgi:hypothetical protein
MIIKNLPELVYMLNIYKNPYLINNYKGIDWYNYKKYINNINIFNISDNLSIISIKKNYYYKIYNKDFINILEGELLIDYNNYNKRITSYYYNINQDFLPCKGMSNYNSFLYYKSNSNF